MKADALNVLEAAYTFEGTEREWLERLCAVANPQFGGSDGMVAVTYRIGEDGRLTPGETLCSSLPPSHEIQLREVLAAMPADYVRDTFARYPSAIATQLGTPEAIRTTRAMCQAWSVQYGWPWRDFVNVNGLDPTGHGLYLSAPLRTEGRMTMKWRTHWDQVATHLAAAFRLRRRLTALEARTASSAEAVLTPSGRVDHAVGAATTTSALNQLREAARVIDKARGSMRRREPDRALAAWTGLVSARWTLIDHFDTDGKRYVLARRNDAQIHGAPSLTDRERQALGYAALGHTNKLIAYEMGISASTVGVLLHRSAKKLRARSRAHLIERFKKTVFTRPR